MRRVLLAGIAGGLTLSLTILLFFRGLGFGWNNAGILIRSQLQSEKFIATWTQTEPLPLLIANPLPLFLILLLFGIGHAFVYRWVTPTWHAGLLQRTVCFGSLLFFMCHLFWGFFTSYNLLGEPLALLAYELVLLGISAFAEALAIAAVMEYGTNSGSGDHHRIQPNNLKEASK